MFQVIMRCGEKNIPLTYQEPVLLSRALQESGFDFSMPCGGKGTCGKCRVTVKGELSEPEEREKALLGNEASRDVRLACMTTVLGDAVVTVREADSRALSEGNLPYYRLEPEGSGLGIAVDVGTTTIAVYLYDLKAGRLLKKDSFLNPQSAYGADVISRIQKAMEGKGEELRNRLLERLRESFLSLCAEQGEQLEAADSIVITGNTTMMYLLLGESTEPLSHAPFAIKEYYGRSMSGEALGIPELRKAKLYVPPLTSAFVGSDITSAILSSGMTRRAETALLIDVGTNGEMALWDGTRLYCCSTAAGPAFEGAGITMGMAAASGAVSAVELAESGIRCSVIGNGQAAGICGSGLIDGAAVLLEAGLIDETGCIEEENRRFSSLLTEKNGEPAVLLGNSGILLTQRDVREIQLAKAAICAGVRTLIHEAGKKAEEIDHLLLAGGFGSFINCKSAGRIGLIPSELVSKSRGIGNAAGMGAVLELLSMPCREESRKAADKAEVVELSSSAYFMEQYVEAMAF